MKTIYCVEDEESIRELVVYALKNSGYEASGFENSASMMQETTKKMPDLILLDIMMPGENGLETLEKLRNTPATAKLPIIMLTAKSSEFDRVRGLDLGADDYICKPFGVMELISRIGAVLRRTESEQPKDIIKMGPLSVDFPLRSVKVNNVEVILTFKEFELLAFLMKNSPRVLTRDQIMDKVWGFDYEGESRTVDVHIKTLRNKLGDAADLILTVRGVGYRVVSTEA